MNQQQNNATKQAGDAFGETPVINYSYRLFNSSKISALAPKEKSFTNDQGKSAKYMEVPLLCDHDTGGKKYSELGWRIEYGGLDQTGRPYGGVWSDGLRSEQKEYTFTNKETNQIEKKVRTVYQVKITFDRRNDDQMELVDKLNAGHLGIGQAFSKYKAQLGLRLRDGDLDSNDGVESFMKRLVYYPKDKLTGQLLEGMNLSQFVSLKGNPDSKNHTAFVGLDGQPVPWEKLEHSDFFWVPLVNYTHGYANGNGNVSVQRSVESGLIIKIKPQDGAERQKNTLKGWQAYDPEAVKEYRNTMAALNGQDEDDQETNQSPKDQSETPSKANPAPLNKMIEMTTQGDLNGTQPTPQVPTVPQMTQPTPQVPTVPQMTQPTPQVPTVPQMTQPTPQVPTVPQMTQPAPQMPTVPQMTQPAPQVPTVPQMTQPAPQVPTIPQTSASVPMIPVGISGNPGVGTPTLQIP